MRSSRPIVAAVLLLTSSAGLTATVAAAEPPVQAK